MISVFVGGAIVAVLFNMIGLANNEVERVALENAASIAGLFLTTECVLVDKPEPASAAPAAAPGMGGMM